MCLLHPPIAMGIRPIVVEQRPHTRSMRNQLNTETHTSCETDPVKAQSSANSLHASFCRCNQLSICGTVGERDAVHFWLSLANARLK